MTKTQTGKGTGLLSYWKRGELGLWPVLIGLLIIVLGFQAANSAFITPRNLSNLALQTATLAVLTLGVMLVLLLGDIDLSIGAVSGLSASVMAVLATLHGWPAWAVILVALAIGAGIGLAQGSWIVAFKAPSFIVTLAGMLVWQGLQLIILSGKSGQVRVEDKFITSIASTYMSSTAGWALAIIIAVFGVASVFYMRHRNVANGFEPESLPHDIGMCAAFVLIPLGITWVMDIYMGVPYLLVIVLVIAVVLAIITKNTVFGRHIYAVGGNAEAARRSGIRVGALTITVFVMASTLAATAGLLDLSRGMSVSVNSGGGNTALNAIAAAVIGGTSLFGGRGTVAGALLGALVISSVQNGLALMGQTAAAQLIATGLILLTAVTLDMVSRNRRKRSK